MSSSPRVGSVAWEKLGGPALTLGQRIALLGGAGLSLVQHLSQLAAWRLGMLRAPNKVDLAEWAPPDSKAARDAEANLRDTSSEVMVHHSHRSYFFSAIHYALAVKPPPIDREALYVGVLLHDVGLFDRARPVGENCFTVSSARAARQVAHAHGWDEARADKMAVAITANLNPSVTVAGDGVEAHYFSLGGQTEVLAKEWQVHPENLREILARHPRNGLGAETRLHVRREAREHPGCRFACMGAVFSTAVAWSHFRGDTH